MIKNVFSGILYLIIFNASLRLLTCETAYAFENYRNITAGEPLKVISVNLTRIDAIYAIKMDCNFDEKLDASGSPSFPTYNEEPTGNYSKTGISVCDRNGFR